MLSDEPPHCQADEAGHRWTETACNGCGRAAEQALPKFGGLWPPVGAEVKGKGAGSRLKECFATKGGGALEAIPEEDREVSPGLDAWLRENLAAGLAQKEHEKEQLEDIRLRGLTGVSRYAELEWRRGKGDLRRLFLENIAEIGEPGAVTFAANALVTTTDAEQFRFGNNIGQGLCGRIDEVTLQGFEGTLALKTIKKVSHIAVLWAIKFCCATGWAEWYLAVRG